MAMQKKYLVLKVQDIEKYLTPDEQSILHDLSNQVTLGRKLDNLKINSYLVVNVDEEYSMIVSELITIGEQQKQLQNERKLENSEERNKRKR